MIILTDKHFGEGGSCISTVKNKEIGTGKYTHSLGTAYLAFSRNDRAVKQSMAEHQA